MVEKLHMRTHTQDVVHCLGTALAFHQTSQKSKTPRPEFQLCHGDIGKFQDLASFAAKGSGFGEGNP